MENEPRENNSPAPEVQETGTNPPAHEENQTPEETTPPPIETPEVESPASPAEQETEAPAVVSEPDQKPKKSKAPLIALTGIFAVLAISAVVFTMMSLNPEVKQDQDNTPASQETEVVEEKPEIEKTEIAIKGNDLDDFDLHFLKMEDEGNKNIVYSPLSIKYALTMLSEGAAGESKKQIDDILGSYHFKPYTNSANLSLANSLFINEVYKDRIKTPYISTLKDRFNSEVIFDDFAAPDNINAWVSDKTFNLVNDILDETDPINDYFYLVNALAIDMEWVNEIQLTNKTAKEQGKTSYSKSFIHEKFNPLYVDYFDISPSSVEFEGEKSLSSRVVAIANKYDIINELGEDGIRSKVQEEYEKWAEDNLNVCSEETVRAEAPDLDEYVDTLSQHYGDLSNSTDFEFYDDEDIKAFAKDLKTYDGTTLQYVGIMPKNESLSDFLKATSAKDLNKTIKNLKKIELNSFNDGVITKLVGEIPHFDFDFDLQLKDDLQELGISDIFSVKNADLTGITDDSGKKNDPNNVYVTKAIHKANIAFSNAGIKAGAATVLGGGKGAAGGCTFKYYFEVPVEEIDLSFNKPYLFLIRDKDSGEIWFAGSVYEPSPAATPAQ